VIPRPYTDADVCDIAEIIERKESQMVRFIKLELSVWIPRLEQSAKAALRRTKERFPSEKNIAMTVLKEDIPYRRRWAETLQDLIADHSALQTRLEFVFGDQARRDAIIRARQEASR
jgi:hypothetical protein